MINLARRDNASWNVEIRQVMKKIQLINQTSLVPVSITVHDKPLIRREVLPKPHLSKAFEIWNTAVWCRTSIGKSVYISNN